MRDGVEVPVSLVYRRDCYQPGTNPLLVYGYGSYGSSMDADFSASRLSLLDRGFVYALTHIRGGGEMGQRWYDDGRLLNKMNTFHDFIDITDALVARQYGDAQKLYAMGAVPGIADGRGDQHGAGPFPRCCRAGAICRRAHHHAG